MKLLDAIKKGKLGNCLFSSNGNQLSYKEIRANNNMEGNLIITDECYIFESIVMVVYIYPPLLDPALH